MNALESTSENIKREESEFIHFHGKGTFVGGVIYNRENALVIKWV